MPIDLNDVSQGLEVEAVTSLADLAEEPGGAWKPGWYAATVIEGYTTGKGKVFATEDAASTKGDSRNLRLCLRVLNGENDRAMQETFNYRPSDLTAERIAFIKEARAEYKGVKGRWADADAQRTSLALASLGQIEKASGIGSFKRTPDGRLVTGDLVGKNLDVRLTVGENGYNEITALAPAGTKTASSKK